MNKLDLEIRTEKFSINIIRLVKKIKINLYNKSFINQIIRSGTSIGANYREAINASSRKDFRNKIFYCKKETEETKFWLKMIYETNEELKIDLKKMWLEADELVKIFQSSINTLNKNIDK